MKLSIITINLNNASGLRKTIESVVSQTFYDFEYIIIDGGSTDGSVDVITEYSDKITYWVSEPDKGIYNAMNKGISHSFGDYILMLNSGDFLFEKDVLRKVVELSKSEDIIYGNIIEETIERTYLTNFPNKPKFSFYFKNSLAHQATFVSKRVYNEIGLYDENNQIASDWCFFMKAFFKNNCSYKHIDLTVAHCDRFGISCRPESYSIIQRERFSFLEKEFPLLIDDYYEMASIMEENSYIRYINRKEIDNKTHKRIMRLLKRLPYAQNIIRLIKKKNSCLTCKYDSLHFHLSDIINRIIYINGFPINNTIIINFRSKKPKVNAKVLLLVPVKPGTPYSVIRNLITLVSRKKLEYISAELVFDSYGESPPEGMSHPYRQKAFANIRQQMIDKYFSNQSFVIFLDVDIIDFPSNLISELVARAKGGIAAPLILKKNISSDFYKGCKFYDVAGFIENDKWARFDYPWFDQPGPVFYLNSVGAFYCVDADIFKNGARYFPDEGSQILVFNNSAESTSALIKRNQNIKANCFTEHFSVCQWALQNGYFVRAFEDLIAYHE